MASIIKSLWGLWPDDLTEMAVELNDSVNALRRARDAGQLPDPRHDEAIGRRARAMNKRWGIKHLKELRTIRPEIELAVRKDVIGKLIDAAGGYEAMSERTGISVGSLRVAKSRGWLPMTKRYEVKNLANELRFDLPEMIFTPPAG